jgi:hypothetical protein
MPVVLGGFTQTLRSNFVQRPQIRSQPLRSTIFPLHYSLTLLFEGIYSEILKALFNK